MKQLIKIFSLSIFFCFLSKISYTQNYASEVGTTFKYGNMVKIEDYSTFKTISDASPSVQNVRMYDRAKLDAQGNPIIDGG